MVMHDKIEMTTGSGDEGNLFINIKPHHHQHTKSLTPQLVTYEYEVIPVDGGNEFCSTQVMLRRRSSPSRSQPITKQHVLCRSERLRLPIKGTSDASYLHASL